MFDEVFYENKKIHRKELIIIVVAYLIVMLLVPYLILHYKIISISANSDSWIVEGQIELAFFIMFLAEFYILCFQYLLFGLQQVSLIPKLSFFLCV